MSYKQPKRVSKRARVFYPALLKVDEQYNPFTMQKDPVLVNTGPYRKDLCKNVYDGIKGYLIALQIKYNDSKTKKD